MATLVRTPIKLNDPIEDADRNFALECAKELGYQVLQQKYDRPHNLADALRKLEIQPFTEKSVRKYKRRKQITESLKHPTILAFTVGFVACALWTVVAPIAAGICWWYGVAAGWYAPVLFVSGIIASLAFTWFTNDLRRKGVYEVEWKKRELCNYYQPVPEFVLQTALDIKRECPYAYIFVDELTVHFSPFDPFLVAKDNNTGEEFYVEVWNEPKFKK